MEKDMRTMLFEVLKDFSNINYITPEDIPDLPLYMDQITSFMDEMLSSGKRYKEDKILTKTMINNYSKNHLLPPSDKKKYSKEHIILLTFIYYLKNFLSIKDIETLLNPITAQYFDSDDDFNILSIYEEVLNTQRSRMKHVTQDIVRSYQSAAKTFTDAPEDEKDYLQLFTFLCNLSFDVYMKKMLMQRLIDNIESDSTPDSKKRKK